LTQKKKLLKIKNSGATRKIRKVLAITYAAPTSSHRSKKWSVKSFFLPKKTILNLFSTLNSIEKGPFG
jgi:hypothetical protein